MNKDNYINLFENLLISRGKRPTPLEKYTSKIKKYSSIPYPIQSDIDKTKMVINSYQKFFLTDLGYEFTPCYRGDLLITGSCDIGNVVELDIDIAYIDDKFIKIVPNKNIDKKFLKFFLTFYKKEILELGTGSTFKCFYLEPFNKWLSKQYLPNISEQQKIASLFVSLDNLIEYIKIKINKLKNLKESLLTNMFVDDIDETPGIRFNGFDDQIKVYNSNEISEVFGSGVDKLIYKNEIKGKIINFVDVFHNVELRDGYNFNNVSFTSEEYKKYKVKWGDVLITPSSEDKIDIGLSSFINIKNTNFIVYSYHLNLIRFNLKMVYPLYMSFQLRTNRIKEYFFKVSQGISRYTLSRTDLLNIKLILPSILEQQKISHTLKLLDEIINDNSIKLNKLQNIKLSLLDQMFVK